MASNAFWNLNRVQTVVLTSTIFIVLIILQFSLNDNAMQNVSPVPFVRSGALCVQTFPETPRRKVGKPFIIVGRDGAFRVEPLSTVNLSEVPPFMYEQDTALLREVKEMNNSNLRFDVYIPPWFDRSDVLRMESMSNGNVSHVFSVPQHKRVKEVIFEDKCGLKIDSIDDCVDKCGVQKSPEDIHEVYAFHVDRVLGFNRSLPAVARRFGGKTNDRAFAKFGDRFSDGVIRPMVWFDPSIRHSGTLQPDQNSMSLWWTDYQRELSYKCFSKDNVEDSLRNKNCTAKIRHIEWGRLAVYDFLLQNHDRIDRSCCGYDRDEGELCFSSGLYERECKDIKRQHLVHIFTRTSDESRLVFIDNVFNPNRSVEHLNYRLLQGIQEIPKTPIAVLKSGKFREMMLQSLYLDKVFWEDQGGRPHVEKLIDIIEKRAQKLITYVDETGIEVVEDY
ncbi:Golgi-associated kinase 1A-like [Ptychodera flava]|uniref:Golgi-associated kinase 1A-like n=1 Tax=Ptychodera flava TaxID=63121 RepID=UPI00396A2A39